MPILRIRLGLVRSTLRRGAQAQDLISAPFTRWLKWMVLNFGDPLYRPFPNGAPGFNPPRPVDSFALSAREVPGETPVTGTIRLAAPAPDGGATFTLGTNPPLIVGVPNTVTVPAGAIEARFTVSPSTVGSYTEVIIYAYGPVTLANTIALDP